MPRYVAAIRRSDADVDSLVRRRRTTDVTSRARHRENTSDVAMVEVCSGVGRKEAELWKGARAGDLLVGSLRPNRCCRAGESHALSTVYTVETRRGPVLEQDCRNDKKSLEASYDRLGPTGRGWLIKVGRPQIPSPPLPLVVSRSIPRSNNSSPRARTTFISDLRNRYAIDIRLFDLHTKLANH